MKKLCILFVLALLLTGCAAPTFEVITDDYIAPADVPTPRKIQFDIPEDAAAQTIAGDTGRLYFCQGYEIWEEILEAGDLERTLQTLTGYDSQNLTVMKISSGEIPRYECAWTCAGENGDQVGRCVILDDGNFHYCVSVMAASQEAGSLQKTWMAILSTVQV